MPLSDHVQITITQQTVGVARPGFGIPLILSANAAWSTDKVRSYTSIAGVAGDFAAGTPEYRAAAAMFAQTPYPQTIKIGKASASAPTMLYTVAIATVANSTPYNITVTLPNNTVTNVSITSGGSATNDAIVSSLVTALNAVSGANYTAASTGTSGSHTITITGNAAGNWFAVAGDPNYLTFACTHTQSGVATDLTNINNADSNWYCLITLYNSHDYVAAAAGWVESNGKIYIADNNDSAEVTAGTGCLTNLNSNSYTRSAGIWHSNPGEMIAAAWAGNCLPLDPGSETWKFKSLAGISADVLTATWRSNLVTNKINCYQTVAGVNITAEGTMAYGGFIDTKRFIDWLTSDISAGVYQVLINNTKVPYTDLGVTMIEAAIRKSLQTGINRGGIAQTPAPVVSAPLVANIDSTNRANRILPNVNFSATLAGAVHDVQITGVVSV